MWKEKDERGDEEEEEEEAEPSVSMERLLALAPLVLIHHRRGRFKASLAPN